MRALRARGMLSEQGEAHGGGSAVQRQQVDVIQPAAKLEGVDPAPFLAPQRDGNPCAGRGSLLDVNSAIDLSVAYPRMTFPCGEDVSEFAPLGLELDHLVCGVFQHDRTAGDGAEPLQDAGQARAAEQKLGEFQPDLLGLAQQFHLVIDDRAMHLLGDVHVADTAMQRDKGQVPARRLVHQRSRELIERGAQPDQHPGDADFVEFPDEAALCAGVPA